MSNIEQMTEYPLSPRRTLKKGTEVTLKGRRGRFLFQYARRVPSGIELTFYGGIASQGQFTTVRPEGVRRVEPRPTRKRSAMKMV